MMRSLSLAIIVLVFLGCRKTGFITTPDAFLRTSADTIHFDTVFTSTGSTTAFFKIFNANDQKLKLSDVQLVGGASSSFRLNLDGTPGVNFNDIEIDANDSIYAFVTVSINPSSANLPFIVRDSIRITYNGNTRYVQLEAFGRNAIFLRNKRITTDTTWLNTQPVVVLGSLTVDAGKTLTITKGVQVYVHADAPIYVDGNLRAIGEKYDSTRIIFQGDRLDEPYKNYPGSWPGILLRTGSQNSFFQFVTVKNAYQGVVAQNPSGNSNPKLTLNECIFDNIYDVAVGGVNSSITARNCQITQAGYNVFLVGGDYNFNFCTIASYGSSYLQHKNPAVVLSDMSGTTSLNLNAVFTNSIIYGEGGTVDDEIFFNKKGTLTFSASFTNILYKMKSAEPSYASFNGNKLKNVNPLFDSVNTSRPYFNFRLKSNSPAINQGSNIALPPTDLDGKSRQLGTAADLGAYEKQ